MAVSVGDKADGPMRRVGTPLGIALLVAPYLFGLLLFQPGYSRRVRTMTALWAAVVVGALMLVPHPQPRAALVKLEAANAPTVSAAQPRLDLKLPMFTTAKTVVCNSDGELNQYEIEMISLDFKASNLIDDGGEYGGCSLWGAHQISVRRVTDDGHALIDLIPEQSNQASTKFPGWTSTLSLTN